MWIVPPVAGLIEPAVAPEIAVDDIGAIEVVNGSVRVYLYSEQMPLEAGFSEPSKVVAVKIRGPLSSLPSVIWRLASCLVPQPAGPSNGDPPFRPHLVR